MMGAADRLRRNTILFMIMMGGVVGCVILGAYLGAKLLDEPPMRFTTARILNPTMKPGEEMRFAVWATGSMSRNCVGTITREFYRPITVDGVDQRLKKRVFAPAPIVISGEDRYVTDVPLPPNMEPGRWSFMAETTYDCGAGWFGGGIRRYRTSEMEFHIVAKTP